MGITELIDEVLINKKYLTLKEYNALKDNMKFEHEDDRYIIIKKDAWQYFIYVTKEKFQFLKGFE